MPKVSPATLIGGGLIGSKASPPIVRRGSSMYKPLKSGYSVEKFPRG